MPARPADDLLLDTHALLWWQAGSERLSDKARMRISSAKRILVSPISCWEVAMLVDKERVQLDRPTAAWVRDLLVQDRIGLAEFTPAVAVAAAELPEFHGDPADRFLYATARSLQADLLSRDRRLQDYGAARGEVRVTW